MSATQLTFGLRVSSGVKTVHLLGSWDGYVGQLPLSKDKSSSKSGSWKGTFRFTLTTLQPGQRYWYYYIIDGYHCSHNPSEESTVEPTTSRTLNILDVPVDSSASKSKSSSGKSSSRHSSSKDKFAAKGRKSIEIPKGRPLSVSQIKSPRPVNPSATKKIIDANFDDSTVEELSHRFASTGLYDSEDDGDIITDFGASDTPLSSLSSDVSSDVSYRSDSSSPNSDLSGYSTPASDCSSCTCERYGITRKGERVRIDCGGRRCGYAEDGSSCSSEDEEYLDRSASRRNGIVVRH
jgi:hypothetical protein